ncbi:mucin-2-like [Scylla paramamosain]|uniref:mucin-2-like n=1 Tax=Scylla paramamosain TaxID=85552 RepID=UPI0030831529
MSCLIVSPFCLPRLHIQTYTHTHTHTHTTMGRGLPPLVVVVVVVALSAAGSALSSTLDLDRIAADTVVKEGETQVIFTTDNELRSMRIFVQFVKPESGFEGVPIVTESDVTINTTWIPAEYCSSPSGTWLVILVGINPLTGVVDDLSIVSDICSVTCVIKTDGRSRRTFRVVVHGPSGWRTIQPLPDECGSIFSPSEQKSCLLGLFATTTTTTPLPCTITTTTIPSPFTITTTPGPTTTITTTTTPRPTASSTVLTSTNSTNSTNLTIIYCKQNKITIVLSVVVLVVVVVMVVVFWKRKSVASPNVVRSQPAVPSRPLQSTSGQRGNPAQDVDPVYYEILPFFSSRRVVVPRPARHSEELVYDDVLPELGVRPRLPIYENVPPPGGSASPHGHLEAPAVRESQLYASVL